MDASGDPKFRNFRVFISEMHYIYRNHREDLSQDRLLLGEKKKKKEEDLKTRDFWVLESVHHPAF
jgi:hypothetical protein